MDQVGIWIGWIFGIIGVVIGVRGEVRARRAEQRLTAQHDAPPWADVSYVSGDLFVIKNQSTRNVEVIAVEPDVERGGDMFEVSSLALPAVIQAGEPLDFKSQPRLGLSRANPIIHWRFTDGAETFTTRRILPSTETG